MSSKARRIRNAPGELRVLLSRCDQPGPDGVQVSPGLLPYVDMVLGKNPDIFKLIKILNEQFFGGGVRGYTYVRSNRRKDCFSYTNFTTKIVYLQEFLFSAGLCRSVLVRKLLHEMIHAFLDTSGADRNENSEHGPIFKKEVTRINRLLGCDLMDDSDVSWDRLRVLNLDKLFICNKCGKKVFRVLSRPPGPDDFYPWYESHRERCGGAFILRLNGVV
ncbi:DNA-dependent metalloprotease SPRTN-like [Diachasmimorpha longicaudata]|uniref:DNA-dependent metalloprotease SPRTN-like n=1 Tax=Diachasmimorpha longicaudata TaxID=58733 RepID=UPI0030B8E240